MARPKAKKSSRPSPGLVHPKSVKRDTGSGLMAMAYDLAHDLSLEDPDTGELDAGGIDASARTAVGLELDPDAVFGASAPEEEAVESPSPLAEASAPAPAPAAAPVAAEPAPAPAMEAPAPPPDAPDLAGGLVAEMQNRFAELQKWADASTRDLQERRARLDALEADLDARREALDAEEQKTTHERERFARYRSAEIEKLKEMGAKAEADAAEVLAQAEADARILLEGAAEEAAAKEEKLLAEARERTASEREASERETAGLRASVEAELDRQRSELDAQGATLGRERQRLAEATAEVEATRSDLDAEWQSVLRLQRSTEALAKAWEAELARRGAPAELRLTGGGEDEDAPQVRLAA